MSREDIAPLGQFFAQVSTLSAIRCKDRKHFQSKKIVLNNKTGPFSFEIN